MPEAIARAVRPQAACRIGGAPTIPILPALIRRRRRKIGEIHVAVRLRPKPDAPGNRLRQRMLEIELAVEVTLDLGAGDADLELVPLAGRGRRVPGPLSPWKPPLLYISSHHECVHARCAWSLDSR